MKGATTLCTSFVSYYGNPIYGMNFDFPEVEMKLRIEKSGFTKYVCFYLNAYGNYYPFAGMNLKGKFTNFQEMYINGNAWDIKEPKVGKEIDAVELFFSFLQERINIDQVKSIKNDTKIIYPENFRVHSMFADVNEKALVLECINGQAVQGKMNGKKIVMTNFSNFLNSDKDNMDLSCIGAERYLTASSMIEEEKDLLDTNKAINILRSTFQKEELYQTLCSLVFNPVKNEVYMIIHRNTDNIWKISLVNETIQNTSCQNENETILIDNKGIIISELG